MTPSSRLWSAIISISAVGVGFVTIAEVESPVRPLIALWFLFICPGMALVPLLRIREGLTEVTLAITLSLVIDTIVAATMLYAGIWSPKLGLVALISISLGGVAFQILAAYGKRHAGQVRSSTLLIAYDYQRSHERLQQGDLQGAIAELDDLIKFEPQSVEMRLERAWLRTRLGDLDGAIADATEAIRFDPQSAVAYYVRGGAMAQRGDRQSALADYGQALQFSPAFSDIYVARGDLHNESGNYGAAIADFRKALALDPNHPSAEFIGQTIGTLVKVGELTARKTHIPQPQPSLSAHDLFERGFAAFQKGDRAAGVEAFWQALELDPNHPDAWRMSQLVSASARSEVRKLASPEPATPLVSRAPFRAEDLLASSSPWNQPRRSRRAPRSYLNTASRPFKPLSNAQLSKASVGPFILTRTNPLAESMRELIRAVGAAEKPVPVHAELTPPRETPDLRSARAEVIRGPIDVLDPAEAPSLDQIITDPDYSKPATPADFEVLSAQSPMASELYFRGSIAIQVGKRMLGVGLFQHSLKLGPFQANARIMLRFIKDLNQGEALVPNPSDMAATRPTFGQAGNSEPPIEEP